MPLRGGRDFLWAHHSGHVASKAAGRGGGLGQVGYPMLTEGGGCWSVQGSAPAPPAGSVHVRARRHTLSAPATAPIPAAPRRPVSSLQPGHAGVGLPIR